MFIGSMQSIIAQSENEEPAEVIAIINEPNNLVPPIRTSSWTSINLTVEDVFGINWTRLSSRFPFRSLYLWPIIHPTWKPFLGYTSLHFEPEIVEGNPNGWRTKVTPSGIIEANQGRFYYLKLEVQADDINVDYAVVVGIKVTRKDVYGNDIGYSYINVPVKASALNNIKMDVDQTTKEAPPHSFVKFTAEITNYGYYRDMFNIHLEDDNGLEVLTSNQVIVLDPSETKEISINVLTPEKFFDPGTVNIIYVNVTSSGDPNPVHIGTLVVMTKGIFISPLTFIILTPIIIVLLILYYLFFIYKKRRDKELYGKPEKPWDLPEEKSNLEKLKKNDPEEYQRVLKKMKDEYKSALNLYESNKNATKKSKLISLNFLSSIKELFKKKEKPIPIKEEKIDEKKFEDKPKRKINILKKEKNEIIKSEEPNTEKKSLKLKDLMNNFSRGKETKKKSFKEEIHEQEEHKTEKVSKKLKGLMNNFSKEKETKKKTAKEVVFVPVEPKKPDESIDEKSLEEQRKLKAILKIKKAQDRQKRKMQK
jgi:hypothetical protein